MLISLSSLSILVFPLNNSFDISTKSNDNESTVSKILVIYFKIYNYVMFFLWGYFFFNQGKNSLPDGGKYFLIESLDKNRMKGVDLYVLRGLLEDLE